MSTFKPLKILASRRQVLKAGLAAMTLSGVTAQVSAKEQPLKTSNGHSKPAAKKAGARRIVMLDPGHGGIDTGAIGHNGSKEKHVVLAIAKNVRSILRSNGIDAVSYTHLDVYKRQVLRFWNNEFEEYEEAVMERILEALESPMPSPRPSP